MKRFLKIITFFIAVVLILVAVKKPAIVFAGTGTELINTTLYTSPNLNYYWQFEGNSNTTVGSNNGTDTNITYSTGNGKFNQGAGFSSGKISLPTTPVSGTGSFTVSLWFKTSSLLKQNILAWGGLGGTAHEMEFYYTNVGTQLNWDGNGFAGGNSGAVTVTDGNWHMTQIVKNSTTCQIYLDDVAVGSSFACSYNIDTNDASGRFIGTAYGGVSTPWAGAMDDFSVFNKALSQSEIDTLWASPPVPVPTATSTSATVVIKNIQVKIMNGKLTIKGN